MKYAVLVFCMLFTLKTRLHAQHFQKSFSTEDTFGGNDDLGIYTHAFSDGTSILVVTSGGGGLLVIKLNQNGDTLFKKFVSGDFSITAATVTSDGGVIACGRDGSFNSHMVAIKIDHNGIAEWSKAYCGATATADDAATSLQQTTDGGYVFTGYSVGIGPGTDDIEVIKTDASGTVSWAKAIGGFAIDIGESIAQTADGGYIISGRTQSFGTGYFDIYLVKLTSQGEVSWSKTYGTTNDLFSYYVTQTADGGYIMTCGYFVFKANSFGDVVWSHQFDDIIFYGTGNVVELSNSHFVLTGTAGDLAGTTIDPFLSELDENGNVIWFKTYGGSQTDYGYYVSKTASGYLVCGATTSFSASGEDAYLFTTDATGNTPCGGLSQNVTTSPKSLTSTTPSEYVGSGAPSSFVSNGTESSTFSENTICSNVEVEQISYTDGIRIYPNPAETFFIIQSDSHLKNPVLEILDPCGRIVMTTQCINGQVIFINDLAPGIYFIRLTNRITQLSIKR